MANVQQVITDTAPVYGYIKGTAKWTKVLEVDDYGKYSINLYPEQEQLDKLLSELNIIQDAAKEEAESKGKKVVLVADILKEDNEGKSFLQFSLPELKGDGTPNKVDIYDVYGKKQEGWDKLIGNGSLVKVKYMFKPYYMASTKTVGLSKRFFALQIIDLVEYGGGDSGFGDETGGDTPFDTDNNNEDF